MEGWHAGTMVGGHFLRVLSPYNGESNGTEHGKLHGNQVYVGIYWVAVKELKVSYHNGCVYKYIYICICISL